ncbi:hypothetical protein COCC4DRAFT_66631 [Bipolaris maydis ATCC 48331]|uniref:Apple domain-containing protein n=2 Tax=Cochliobolus heterostrophus TaxID=5016 RepID=M2TTM2_COCH5|nr:uncharacterized protein COCC4DRAFT_66631 [Bipolaris maydis ATCC 48331]EMD85126.1 hypothetical protein COCHEDRAFT_1219646 [Bipolaris maydis C5]ENH99210.1 hypothetical protein COCC4DRAFT_66631 [Bipolaris maydis ATCC 48331]
MDKLLLDLVVLVAALPGQLKLCGLTTTTLGGLISLASSRLIDLDYVESVPDPTYTIIPDQRAQIVSYNQGAAIDSDVVEALQSPIPDPGANALQARYFDIQKRWKPCQDLNNNANTYNAVLNPAESFVMDENLASFNTYFEHSPSKVPGPTCPNPEGAANPFFVLWGSPVTTENARNEGQKAFFNPQNQESASDNQTNASNGYVLTSSLNPLSNKAIDAPLNCNNNDSYMDMRLLNDNAPFDPQRCEAVCEATSQYNIDHPGDDPSKLPRLCKFYNTYILNGNFYSQGLVCAMYTESWDPSVYAMNDGQWRGDDHYTTSSSVFFYNTTDVTTPVCPTDIDRLRDDADAGAFCTSFNSYVVSATSTITSYTSTTTIDACGAPTAPLKRDGESDNATVTGSTPAMITIPAEQLDAPGVYASASSAAIAQLIGSDSEPTTPVSPLGFSTAVTPTSTPSPTTPASTAGLVKRAVATPPIFAGRQSREISSACSRIISIVTPTVIARAQATEITYNNCAQYIPLPAKMICIYETCSAGVNPSSNGLITLGGHGVADYFNYNIPNFVREAVLMAFWIDLFITRGRQHYMDYSICGDAGHRTVTFDWRVTYCCDSTSDAIYSFSVKLFEDHPGRVHLNYFGTRDQGRSATIESFFKYSYGQPCANHGLELIFDPAPNYFGRA